MNFRPMQGNVVFHACNKYGHIAKYYISIIMNKKDMKDKNKNLKADEKGKKKLMRLEIKWRTLGSRRAMIMKEMGMHLTPVLEPYLITKAKESSLGGSFHENISNLLFEICALF